MPRHHSVVQSCYLGSAFTEHALNYQRGIDTDRGPRNEFACSTVSTIFVTVPPSTPTETIYALGRGSNAPADIEALVNGAARLTSTAVTTTVTTPVTSTQVIRVIQASSPAEGQAAYSFTEENGTTTWLGATPPSSASLITSTQVVTLQPVPPGYLGSQEDVTPLMSYLTHSSTETVIETRTETQTLDLPTASALAGAYTGFASNGWNSSILTFITVKSLPSGSVPIAEKLAYHSGTAYAMASSGIARFLSEKATRHIKARSVGKIVVATIDGAAVSWTNNYNGTSPSTSDKSPTVVPVTATPPQPEPLASRKFPRLWTGHQLTHLQAISGTFSSPVQTESSSPTGPTTTVSVYTWDVLLDPSLISALSSSAGQPATGHAVPSPSSSNTSTASSTTATATASSCGDTTAKFVIDFDDLPTFSAGPGVCT